MITVYYRIEEFVFVANGKSYWSIIAAFGGEVSWRTENEERAWEVFSYIQSDYREIRLVRVTEEILGG